MEREGKEIWFDAMEDEMKSLHEINLVILPQYEKAFQNRCIS